MDELDGLDELKDVWVHISLEKSNYYRYCWPITHAIECEKKSSFFPLLFYAIKLSNFFLCDRNSRSVFVFIATLIIAFS